MQRMGMALPAVICLLGSAGCDLDINGQSIDVSKFERFEFSRAVEIGSCFAAGDVMALSLTAQADNRLLNYTMLTEADAAAAAECVVLTEDDVCLVESAPATRVLVDSENRRVNALFGRVVIANQPADICGTGNVTVCSEDLYTWDGLTVAGDFCQPVHVSNSFDVMRLLEDLRDGPPAEDEEQPGADPDVVFSTTPVEILRVEDIIASDQLIGKSGDFIVVRDQSDLDGVLFQDGSAALDFTQETGVAVMIFRPPCQEFGVSEAVETFLSVDIQATLRQMENCFLDLGSVDAHLIVIPRTTKIVRLFLNGSELDEDDL